MRFDLEERVGAEFFARDAVPQKAAESQWRAGCERVRAAVQLGHYPDVPTALEAFAKLLVDAVAAGKPPALGLALQQVQLGAPLEAPGRQLSELTRRALERGGA